MATLGSALHRQCPSQQSPTVTPRPCKRYKMCLQFALINHGIEEFPGPTASGLEVGKAALPGPSESAKPSFLIQPHRGALCDPRLLFIYVGRQGWFLSDSIQVMWAS